MPQRPNILFILSDQQRWDTVGCYGASPVEGSITPNLDRLAAEGVRFKHAFTCQPLCGPARSCLQSGVYATETGCFTNNRALPEGQVTVAKLLAAAGYETAYVGKWHLAADQQHREYRTGPIPPARRGGYRDYWVASDTLEYTSHGYEGYFHDGEGRRIDWEGYRVDRTTDFAVDYLRQYGVRGGSKPFLLFLSYLEPHQQNDLNRYVGPMGSKQRFAGFRPPPDLAHQSLPEGDWRPQYPDYLGCCASIDENVGRLRRELEQLGLLDNTLIVYTSDHGCHFRTRNSEYKRSCHDGSIRVPLIVRGPGFRGGGAPDELVSLIDVPATVVAAAGVAVPAHFRGRALQPLGAWETDDWPQEVFIQISESEVGRAIRTRRWKYAVAAPVPGSNPLEDAGSDRYVEAYLYDLQQDPCELRNLAGDAKYRKARAELAAILKRRMREAGEAEPVLDPAG